ncbi:MAG: hypothetical protein BA870_09030 [Desulfuromonadales bacterium C00003094]|nr:MAG: hypothetical protein BA870_09030 [Desulfuromonadales bacterium C00003094]OEU78002.1 MAG: hypothetical protein BA869_03480 [Desulfuromonadales bacterium C00003107]
MRPTFISQDRCQRVMRWLAASLLTFTLCGCTRHLIHHWQETSRDYTYIDFSRNPSPYKFSGQVGGEHTTYLKVLGFKGDHFTIAMQQEGDAGFTVYGEGLVTRRTAMIHDVIIEGTDALLTIEISAYSYGDYVLTISKK